MNQQNEQNSPEYASELDKRLTAFYGPQLREQPLPHTSWDDVRKRLVRRQTFRQRINWKYLLRRRKRVTTPLYIQQAFEHVTFSAHMRSDPLLLKCTFKAGAAPSVRLTPYGTRIQLLLPSSMRMGMDMIALDTLLTTGLARYRMVSRLRYRTMSVFPIVFLLLSGLLLFLLWGKSAAFFVAPFMVAIIVIWLLLASQLKRNLWLASDALAVQWLGRERICAGLHRLADYERVLQRRRWGEPSLAERIERVCGTQVETRDDSLTLVR